MANVHGLNDVNNQGQNNQNGIRNGLLGNMMQQNGHIMQQMRQEKVPFLMINMQGNRPPLQETIPYTCRLVWCPKIRLFSLSTFLILALWILFIICCTQGLTKKEWSLLAIDGQVLLDFGGLNGDLVIHHHQYWRLITAAFLHADLTHITSNTIFLLFFLTQFQHIYPLYCNISMLLVSAICGSSLSICVKMEAISVGSSSMIFGLIGCLIGYLIINWPYLGSVKSQLACLYIFICIMAILSSFGDSVDMAAHLGGLLGGILCSVAFFPAIAQKNKIIMYIGIGGLAIVFLLMILLLVLR